MRWVLKKSDEDCGKEKEADRGCVSFSESYLPKVLLASGAAGRPVRYGL